MYNVILRKNKFMPTIKAVNQPVFKSRFRTQASSKL